MKVKQYRERLLPTAFVGSIVLAITAFRDLAKIARTRNNQV